MTPLLPHDFPKGVSEELGRLHGILLQSEDKELKEWAKGKIEAFYKPFLNPAYICEKESDTDHLFGGFIRRR